MMRNDVGVGGQDKVEGGRRGQSAGALPPSLLSVPPPLFVPTDTDLLPFSFLGAPVHHPIRRADVWDRASPLRESAGETGALLSVSFWVIAMRREEEEEEEAAET